MWAGLILLYLPVVLVHVRLLAPRLSAMARRLSAIMLALQLILIVVALEHGSSAPWTRWLWNMHEEWNILATFASMQLALVGAVALAVALFARAARWRRVYQLLLGLVFLFLALDEFLALHEGVPNWEARYIVLGAAVVLATLYAGLRAPSRERPAYAVLLVGLAVSVAGAFVLNAVPTACDELLFLRLDGCLQFYVWEESLEFLGIWLALVGQLALLSGRLVGAPGRVGRALCLFPACWLLLLLANSLTPRLEVRALARTAQIRHDSGVTLSGYRLDGASIRAGAPFTVWLYATAAQGDFLGLGYSVHLVDQVSGDSIAQRDDWADRQHGFWPFGPDYTSVFRQRMDVHVPADSPVNRALDVVLTLWRKQGAEFVWQPVVSGDHRVLNEAQVILGEVVLPAPAAGAAGSPLARFENGFSLLEPALPESAMPGETLEIRMGWSAAAATRDDHAQFLHFIHEESGVHWAHDRQPLGPRLPTRLWYGGLSDSEVWQVPVPAGQQPGRYLVFTGLYRRRDLERVAARDVDGTPLEDNRVPLGVIEIHR